jgi:hypothetical protein
VTFEVGRVYIVPTRTLAPHDKIVICCLLPELFFWINSAANRRHPAAQCPIAVSELPTVLRHDSVIDLSRVTTFPPNELAGAQPREQLPPDVVARIVQHLTAGVPTLTGRQLASIIAALTPLL